MKYRQHQGNQTRAGRRPYEEDYYKIRIDRFINESFSAGELARTREYPPFWMRSARGASPGWNISAPLLNAAKAVWGGAESSIACRAFELGGCADSAFLFGKDTRYIKKIGVIDMKGIILRAVPARGVSLTMVTSKQLLPFYVTTMITIRCRP